MRDCPRCGAPLTHDVGRDEDEQGDIREVTQCTVCSFGYTFTPERWTPEQVRQRLAVAAWIRDAGCICGHPWEVHAIGTRNGRAVRTACSSGFGTRGTRCDCRLYQPISFPSEETSPA